MHQHTNRLIHLIVVVFQCSSSSGIIYGWVSLLPLLEQNGVYRELCSGEFINTCSAQSIQLHFAFTIATSFNMGATLVSGILFDRKGARVCKIVSFFALILGTILVSCVDSSHSDLFLPGLALIGFGGPGIQLASVHISNLFPKSKSAITCIVVGSVQLSFFVFTIFNYLGTMYHWSLQQIFLSYALILVFNIGLSFIVDPDKPFRSQHSNTNGIIRLPSRFKEEGQRLLERTPPVKRPLRGQRDLKQRSFRVQVFSAPFLHLTTYFSIGTIWSNYLVGSLKTQLGHKGLDPAMYMSYFDIIMPGGVILVPFLGYFIERCGFISTTFLSCVLALSYTLLLDTDSFSCLIGGFVIYSIYRSALFAISFAYTGHRFGYNHFGALSGVMFSVAGVAGLLQTPLSTIQNENLVTGIQFWTLVLTFSLPFYEFQRRQRHPEKDDCTLEFSNL